MPSAKSFMSRSAFRSDVKGATALESELLKKESTGRSRSGVRCHGEDDACSMRAALSAQTEPLLCLTYSRLAAVLMNRV